MSCMCCEHIDTSYCLFYSIPNPILLKFALLIKTKIFKMIVLHNDHNNRFIVYCHKSLSLWLAEKTTLLALFRLLLLECHYVMRQHILFIFYYEIFFSIHISSSDCYYYHYRYVTRKFSIKVHNYRKRYLWQDNVF